MLTIFLDYLDQFRAVAGLIAVCFLFCCNAVARRERFLLRVTVCGCVCIAAGFAYVPLEPVLASWPVLIYGFCSAAYWIVVTGMVCVSVYVCYEITVCNALFRTVLGYSVETIVTTVLRYLIVMMWLPDLPMGSPVMYVLLGLAIYVISYYAAYRLLAVRLQKNSPILEQRLNPVWSYVIVLLALLLIIFATNGICEWVIPSMGGESINETQFQLIRYFCIGIRLMVSTAFLVSQYFVFETSVLQYERDLVGRLLEEKSAQYAFNRENIEFIRRKCHDLKRQLRALELTGEDERRRVIEETRRAAEFYDAAVHTGNEVLDTILTEKNLLCVNRNIRLSCTVTAGDIDKIGVVDLYTILSNALDNAIESAERFTEPDKKTISFSVTERGKILYIIVENYYEGTISMREGIPLTRKADKANHGIGITSIRTLAKQYGGDIRISTDNQIFLLEIMIPLSR